MIRVVILLVLLPAIAGAEAPGVKLLYHDAAKLRRDQTPQDEFVVGTDRILVLPGGGGAQAQVFNLNGERQATLPGVVSTSGCFVGDHLYLAMGIKGLRTLSTKDWSEVDALRLPTHDYGRMAATPDGRSLFVLTRDAPATLTIYDRDPNSGKLTKSQVFQPDENGLTAFRHAQKAFPNLRLELDQQAIRLPLFETPTDIVVSPDGERAFIASMAGSVTMLTRADKTWRNTHVRHQDPQTGDIYGVAHAMSLALHDTRLFVGGVRMLGLLDCTDGKLRKDTWWVDDTEAIEMEPAFPFIDNLVSLAFSKNGRFLFLVSSQSDAIQICRTSGRELEPFATIKEPVGGSKMLQVAVSDDGTRLFARSQQSQLLVYELDGRFVDRKE